MPSPKSIDWIADAERAGAELKEAVRQAHEAIRDLKSLMKEWKALQAEIPKEARKEFDALVNTVVVQGLADYRESLQAAIKRADAAVERRFDKLTSIMLGEDQRSGKTIEEYAWEIRKRKVRDPLADL
jgi:Lon protease-like protein